MYRKIVVLACILALGLSGCSTSKTSKKTFTLNSQKERIIITATGEPWITGYRELSNNELSDAFPGLSRWGSPSLLRLTGLKENLKKIKSSHTIFMIRPECLYDFENLEVKYPNLLPTSTEKLKSYLKTYGYPLLYFSYDSTGMIRGVVIAKKITLSLLTKLLTKSITLDIPLQYENSELKKAEKKKLEKKKSFTWESKDSKEEIIITVTGRGRRRVNGCDEFAEELEKVVWVASCWGADSLLNFTETFTNENRDIELMKGFKTIFMVRPQNLYDLEGFETKYPDLLPVSTEKLKSYLKTYDYPLLYFSYDYTGVLKGVIIAKEVTPALAKLLVEKPIPLDTPLAYKNGKLEKLEK